MSKIPESIARLFDCESYKYQLSSVSGAEHPAGFETMHLSIIKTPKPQPRYELIPAKHAKAGDDLFVYPYNEWVAMDRDDALYIRSDAIVRRRMAE